VTSAADTRRVRILFVCLGNICRSPTAEAVLRTLAAGAAPELELEIDSAGTAGYHIGEPPDPRTRAAASRRGYDLTALRARIVEPDDFERFDLILAMDRENLTLLRRRANSHRTRASKTSRIPTMADRTASRRSSTSSKRPHAG
jgi:protein-tyrosine phosphatase